MSLHFELVVPARVALDQPLVVGARLRNDGDAPVTTSARLNLHEGDLLAAVTRPDGTSGQVVWAWPIDSALREVELAPGELLEGGVLLHWAVAGLVMPVAGRYTVAASFTASHDVLVEAEPVDVVRADAVDDDGRAAQGLVSQEDVARSLASASTIGAASDALDELAQRGPPTARLLAGLARSDPGEVRGSVADVVSADGPVTAAAVVTASVPPGLFPDDERVAWAGEALAAAPGLTATATTTAAATARPADAPAEVDRARALLAGRPHTAP